MTHQPHELSNLFLAGKYFESLPSDDVSRRFAAGEKYVSSWYNRLKIFFSIDSTLRELNHFYPHQPIVKRTYELYQERRANSRNNAVLFSAVSIPLVYFLAKRNFVLPILSRFGKFLKTHRLFRQYVWLLLLPTALAEFQTNSFFLNQTDKLWQVHASRMNAGIFEDPQDSQYPLSELPVSQIYSWKQPFVHPYDRPNKWANEVEIFLAPDYNNVQEWEKVPVAPAVQEEEGGEQGGEEEQQ